MKTIPVILKPDTEQKSNRGVGRSYAVQKDLVQNVFDMIISENYGGNILLFEEQKKAVDSGKREHLFGKTQLAIEAVIPDFVNWDEKKQFAVKREICRALRGEKQYGYKIKGFVKDWKSRHDVSQLEIPVDPTEDFSGLNPLLEKAREMSNPKPDVTAVSSKSDIAESIVAMLEAGANTIETDGTTWKVSK
tara:strand:+ start:1504 stop:2076 length:573 start_codon:yes stop_codon:yes gene_type:complete